MNEKANFFTFKTIATNARNNEKKASVVICC